MSVSSITQMPVNSNLPQQNKNKSKAIGAIASTTIGAGIGYGGYCFLGGGLAEGLVKNALKPTMLEHVNKSVDYMKNKAKGLGTELTEAQIKSCRDSAANTYKEMQGNLKKLQMKKAGWIGAVATIGLGIYGLVKNFSKNKS